MTGILILFCISMFILFIAYQILKYRRTFWFAPTIIGFKNRKKMSTKLTAQLIGIPALVFGSLIFILALKSLIGYLHK
ncbi:MAG: hypothetical protein B6I22_03355 [Desulfobacteraceae bacterium 4572_123]|nr:MAG: hypothetical protein B6I22_03355 [Desulfobacteraceae bacterium 4572_123]